MSLKWMLMCPGLVLLNSAGRIDTAYQAPPPGLVAQEMKKAPPGWVVDLISQGLFGYLEKNIAK